MSTLDEIPDPWRQAMERAGVYSLTQLSDKTKTGVSTLSDLVRGRRRTSEATMQAVADSLRLPVTTIREWAATARGEARPFELPAEANRLTKRERDAVLAVVRAMLDPAGRAEQEPIGRPVTELRPPQPDLSDRSRIAARRGKSVGRRLRKEQDDDTENP